MGEPMIDDPRYRPRPVYLELGEGFADPVEPARFPRHVLRFRNQAWAERVGLGALSPEAWEACFARFEPLPGNLGRPLAMRYHGHQFHAYNKDLGDGRGFLHAQLLDPGTGRVLDLATKGSGRTPYSRGGDGRLTLQGGVREILASEMLEALGVPTSRTFSLFETGEALMRSDEPSPTRSSVLVRLGHSHLRFGTFQRHAYEGRVDRLRALVEHAIAHYLPEARGERDAPLALLRAVCARSAELTAAWMASGFVHGVLNTDNLTITGESFDYGPWRFLPRFDPGFTAAYFDEVGLYAYGVQPRQVLWSLTRLAESLRELVKDLRAEPVMRDFDPIFRRAFARRWRERLGLAPGDPGDEEALLDASHAFLAESEVGYERFVHDWRGGADRALAGPAAPLYAGGAIAAFRSALERFEPDPALDRDHPALAAPCTLIIEEVRAIWAAIADRDDWAPLEAKVAAIRAMGAATGRGAWAHPPDRASSGG